MAKKLLDTTQHVLVPKHKKLSDKERQKLLKKYNITLRELPKILITDPALINLKVEEGDVIEIEREAALVGKTIFYRCVING
jgi:DNA-directed RNA polymerase subunit H